MLDKEPHNKDLLCNLCAISPNIYNGLMSKGVIELEYDLIKCLSSLVKHYKNNDDLKREKMNIERENIAAKREYMKRLSDISSEEDTMHPILRSEKLQKIRLDKAKEYEVWTKIKLAKENTLNPFDLTRLLSPFLQVIKNSLNQLATNEPTLQQAVDKCLKSLSDFGETMIVSANEDLDEWVKEQSEGMAENELNEIDKILLGVTNHTSQTMAN